MSRIADVLQKARTNRARAFSSEPEEVAGELTLRTLGEVQIPWQLGEGSSASGPAGETDRVISPRPVVLTPPKPREDPGIPDPDDETILLARKLFLGEHAPERKRVLFTPVDAGRHTVRLLVGLGLALSRAGGGSVCLVDCDLDGSRLHTLLRLRGTPGVSDIVLDGASLETCTQLVPAEKSLRLLAAGSHPGELRSALRGPHALARLRAVMKSFDIVVAQSTPGSPEDAALVGACFDGVVLVLDTATTTKEATRAAAAVLQTAGVRVLGTVLNDRHRNSRDR